MENTSRDKLVWTASKLFQERGYHGVGLSEILAVAGLPKGSLYHHFPNGKADLALEAAALAHRQTTRIIDEAFQGASSYEIGATTLCHKFAKLFDVLGKATGCPISGTLFGGPKLESFRLVSATYFEEWISLIEAHALRLGEEATASRAQAERLFLGLQGGWLLARARKDADVLRRLPQHIFADKL